ncbi:hypothetical protein K7X08_030596 [Anisodus acutangulus]|uniref:Uncharacterized protein n=1 Tax=Anisodus acutangulus TaxID=402998 RepID=A0A9Q1RP47_9SOLA|nr:hypothetical protein K7X08_030596 [Anisodus acutangulus]
MKQYESAKMSMTKNQTLLRRRNNAPPKADSSAIREYVFSVGLCISYQPERKVAGISCTTLDDLMPSRRKLRTLAG